MPARMTSPSISRARHRQRTGACPLPSFSLLTRVRRPSGRAAHHDRRGPMAFLVRRHTIFVAVIATALACSIPPAARAEDAARADNAGQAASPPADAAAADMILIEYVPPKDPKYLTSYKLVQERGALEMMRKVFTPLRLPVPV